MHVADFKNGSSGYNICYLKYQMMNYSLCLASGLAKKLGWIYFGQYFVLSCWLLLHSGYPVLISQSFQVTSCHTPVF